MPGKFGDHNGRQETVKDQGTQARHRVLSNGVEYRLVPTKLCWRPISKQYNLDGGKTIWRALGEADKCLDQGGQWKKENGCSSIFVKRSDGLDGDSAMFFFSVSIIMSEFMLWVYDINS